MDIKDMLDMVSAGDEEQETTEKEVKMNFKEMAEVARHFTGLRPDGLPKAFVNYTSYDFSAPEDDIDRQTVSTAHPARAELSLDKMTGFFTLDLIFRDENDMSLKLLWAKLQKYKSDETYMSDRTWIFYIKMFENIPDEELGKTPVVYTADIMNPLAFFLIRSVPEQKVRDFEVEPGKFSGGNTIRLLLHPDLVTFRYEELENDMEQDEDGTDETSEDTDIPEEE